MNVTPTTCFFAFHYPEVEHDGLRIQIVHEHDPADPREWDNIGTMVCFHRYHQLGDAHNYSNAAEMWEDLAEQAGADPELAQTQEGRALIDEKFLVLPLYLYDHSGLTMSTRPFSCPWDSGQVGIIYADREEAGQELGNCTEANLLRVLTKEVDIYDCYLQDDVYGYILTKADQCASCGHNEWTEVDSVWGFYGSDIDANGLLDALPRDYRELILQYEPKRVPV